MNNNNIATPQPGKTGQVMYKQHVIVKPPPPKQMKNKIVMCKPYMHTKGVSCRPHPCTKETQTGEETSFLFLSPSTNYNISPEVVDGDRGAGPVIEHSGEDGRAVFLSSHTMTQSEGPYLGVIAHCLGVGGMGENTLVSSCR